MSCGFPSRFPSDDNGGGLEAYIWFAFSSHFVGCHISTTHFLLVALDLESEWTPGLPQFLLSFLLFFVYDC